MPMRPNKPVRADHRVIHRILETMGGTVETRPSEFSLVADIFVQAGGSWERLHRGSIKDMSLLKRVISIGIDKGYITKKETW